MIIDITGNNKNRYSWLYRLLELVAQVWTESAGARTSPQGAKGKLSPEHSKAPLVIRGAPHDFYVTWGALLSEKQISVAQDFGNSCESECKVSCRR